MTEKHPIIVVTPSPDCRFPTRNNPSTIDFREEIYELELFWSRKSFYSMVVSKLSSIENNNLYHTNYLIHTQYFRHYKTKYLEVETNG